MRIVWRTLSIVASFLLTGCAQIGSPALTQQALQVPAAQRDQVYTFFLNSPNDPLRLTGLGRFSDYVRDAGFQHTQYHTGFTSSETLVEEIRAIRRRDPQARIVLIAWSGASLTAFDAAKILAREGKNVDEIIYLDSQWLIDFRTNQQAHPQNVGRVLFLYRAGHTPPAAPHSEWRVVPTSDHLAVALHPYTVENIIRELVDQAQRRP